MHLAFKATPRTQFRKQIEPVASDDKYEQWGMERVGHRSLSTPVKTSPPLALHSASCWAGDSTLAESGVLMSDEVAVGQVHGTSHSRYW